MFEPDSPNRIINFRPLFIAAVGLITGIALFEAVLSNRSAFVAVIIAAAVISAAAFFFAAVKGRKTMLVFAAAVLIGLARMCAAVPDAVEKGEYRLTGTVVSVTSGKTDSVVLASAALNGQKLKNRVKLTVKSGDMPFVGDSISADCTAQNPSRRFGGYDERKDLLSKNISVTAVSECVSVTDSGKLPITEKLYQIKTFLKSRIDLLFADEAPIVSGFLLGDKSGIDETDVESFRTTGTAHLLSLSGFHVGVLTALLFFLLPKRYPRLRIVLISLFLIAYCAIAAFPASLVRASLMCFCLMLSEVTEERRDPLSSLSLAALIILIISPYSLWSVGFRLSFAATLGILLITSTGQESSFPKVVNRIISAVEITLGATAATALISARYFGTFPTYGLLANVIAVPLFSAAITLSFIVLLIGIPFPGAAAFAAYVPEKLIDGAMFILRKIEALPYSSIQVAAPSTLSSVLMLLMLFTISAYVLRPIGKRLKLTCVTFLMFTASLIADIIKA